MKKLFLDDVESDGLSNRPNFDCKQGLRNMVGWAEDVYLPHIWIGLSLKPK